MNDIEQLKIELYQFAIPESQRKGKFFKTGQGDYAEHDIFIGVPVPKLRQLAKSYDSLSLPELSILLQSSINEERLLTLIILVARYQKGDLIIKKAVYDFYLEHIGYVNNWNLVDSSAHLIIGAYLYDKDKTILLQLGQSSVLWERRIAIVATWYFIRHYEFEWTIKMSKLLLEDTHDLIHKAVGWMLREAGKKNPKVLTQFLDQYADKMPRTMLRYSIEKLSPIEKSHYLTKKSKIMT